MAIDFTPQDVGSGFNLTKLNENFQNIDVAFQDALSRSGASPNQMLADIDLNNNDLLNVSQTKTNELFINGSLVTPDALQTIPSSVMLKGTYDPTLKQIPPMFPDNYDPASVQQDVYDRKWQGDFNTEAQFVATNIPTIVQFVTTAGYITAGDGGGHRKVRIATPSPVEAWHKQSADGAWWAIDRNQPLNIRAFGGSASVDSTTAAQAMAEYIGHVRLPLGSTLFSTTAVEFAVPFVFDNGAKMNISTGVTVFLEGRIYAPAQQIFEGNGTPRLRQNGDHGEDSKTQVWIHWWGMLPTNSSDVDNSPAWAKMMTSLGNDREAEVLTGVGSWYFHSGSLALNRGVFIKGAGDRMTTFWITFNTGDVFVTAEQAVRMDGIQINALSGPRTSGAYIRSQHTRCKFTNIYMDGGYEGIVLEGTENHARHIKGLTWANTSGSSLVKITGDDSTAKDVDFTNSTTAKPETIVYIDATAKNVLRPIVRDVRGDAGSNGVFFRAASTFGVQSPSIREVNLKSCGHSAVRGLNDGSGGFNDLDIDGIVSPVGAINAISIVLTSTGPINNGVIANVIARGQTDNGIKVDAQSTGVARGLVIAPCSVNGANNGVYVAGTGSPHEDITISGVATKGGTDGFELKANGVTMFGCTCNNSGTGYRILSGSDNILVHSQYNGGGTALTDGSGAVTKSITIL